MIVFEKESYRFAFRIAGVAISNNKVLLHRSEYDNFWALPGGRCEFLENSKETLIREMKEEMGVRIKVIRPLYFIENFFYYEGKNCQELSIIYLMKIPSNFNSAFEKEEFFGEEQNLGLKNNDRYGEEIKLFFKWFHLNKLHKVELYPSFLRGALKNLKPYPEHIIHKDN